MDSKYSWSPQNISSIKKGRLQTVCNKTQNHSGRLLTSKETKNKIIFKNRFRPIQPKLALQFANDNYVTITIDNKLQYFQKKNSNLIPPVTSYKLEETGVVTHTSEPSASVLLVESPGVNSLEKNFDQGRTFHCTLCCKDNITLKDLDQHLKSLHSLRNKVTDIPVEIPRCLDKNKDAEFYCGICKGENITVEEWPKHVHYSSQWHESLLGRSYTPAMKCHIKCVSTGENTSYTCSACKEERIYVEDLPHHISLNCSPTSGVNALEHLNIHEVTNESNSVVHPTVSYRNKDNMQLTHINCSSNKVDNLKIVNYSCTVCNVNNMTINQMFNHISCNPDVGRNASIFPDDSFACSHCGNSYKTKVLLKKHVLMHTQLEACHCNFCDRGFQLKSSLKKHLLTQHNEVLKIFKCPTCSETFSSKNTLKDHKCKSHMPKLEDCDLGYQKIHLCSMCGKNFTTRSNLRSHEVRMHNTKPKKHICEVCGRGFDHAVRLRLHLMKHSGTKNVICEVCGRRFYQNSELYKHMTCHSQDRPFVCKYCDGTFKRRCNLTTHEAMMHGVVAEGYKSHLCTVCGKTFLIAKLLADHMESHSGEKFCCSKCGKEFVDKRSYTWHVKNDCKPRPHTKRAPSKNLRTKQTPEGRSYQCKVCGKIFKASSNLGQHVRKVHEKDKYDKFCCTICGKLFKWKVCLNEHLRIHLNLKPCICKVCNKAFRTWSSLARHKKVHEEFRAYQCQMCGKAFRQRGHLRVHLNLHSGVKPYPCGLCERSFLYNSEKIKHENKHHNIMPELQ